MAAAAFINSLVFFDTETTGLDPNARITELSMIAVPTEHFLNCAAKKTPIRVVNKLSLCLNPKTSIHFQAAEITGLYNDMLQQNATFSNETVLLVNSFLQQLPPPVCLIAHNGNKFDYPVLHRQLQRIDCTLIDGLLCVDSLEMFKQHHDAALERKSFVDSQQQQSLPVELQDDDWDLLMSQKLDELEHQEDLLSIQRNLEVQQSNETTPNKNKSQQHHMHRKHKASKKLCFEKPKFNLPSIYERLTGKEPVNVHSAEGDAFMILECGLVLGEEFLSLVGANALFF